jgi:hypothetical protein
MDDRRVAPESRDEVEIEFRGNGPNPLAAFSAGINILEGRRSLGWADADLSARDEVVNRGFRADTCHRANRTAKRECSHRSVRNRPARDKSAAD